MPSKTEPLETADITVILLDGQQEAEPLAQPVMTPETEEQPHVYMYRHSAAAESLHLIRGRV